MLAVGEGKRDEHGKRIPLELSVDDVIYFGKCTGSEIKLNGKEYLVMREEDVIAKTL